MGRDEKGVPGPLVGWATEGNVLDLESTEDEGKGCYTKLSILSRTNFIQKLRAMVVSLLLPLLGRLSSGLVMKIRVHAILFRMYVAFV